MSTGVVVDRSEPAGLGAAPRVQRRRVNKTLVTGVCVFGTVVFLAILAPWVTDGAPNQQNLLNTLGGFSSSHLLGTDELGRDIWARVVYGGRTDLHIACLAVLFPFVLGTTLGCLAGYFGRWVDFIVMRLVEVVVAFPFYVLVIALVFVLGPGTRSIYIAITVVGWVSYTRIVRGEVLIAKRQEYVLAAHSGGLSRRRIIVRHVLPNVITQAIVFAMSDVVLDILVIVTLGYLGLGVPPPTPDWGQMISDAQAYITTNPMLSVIPGLAVVMTGFGLSLIGDGLAEVLKPE